MSAEPILMDTVVPSHLQLCPIHRLELTAVDATTHSPNGLYCPTGHAILARWYVYSQRLKRVVDIAHGEPDTRPKWGAVRGKR